MKKVFLIYSLFALIIVIISAIMWLVLPHSSTQEDTFSTENTVIKSSRNKKSASKSKDTSSSFHTDENTEDNSKSETTNNVITEAISEQIYRTIGDNNPALSAEKIKELKPVVRKNSIEQSYDSEKGIHSMKYIIDIESAKQSYGVKRQWVEPGFNPRPEDLDEWSNVVYCLPEKDLIYGHFDCKDLFTMMAGE